MYLLDVYWWNIGFIVNVNIIQRPLLQVCVSTAPGVFVCPLLQVCVCVCDPLGWVKYREHISLLVILCIIMYVKKKKKKFW